MAWDSDPWNLAQLIGLDKRRDGVGCVVIFVIGQVIVGVGLMLGLVVSADRL